MRRLELRGRRLWRYLSELGRKLGQFFRGKAGRGVGAGQEPLQAVETAQEQGAWPQTLPGGEVGPRAPARRPRSIIVGLDFGTSTTKVVWHDTTEDVYEVFRWNEKVNGVESPLLPSLIAVREGQVWFGYEAASLPSPELRIPWIKICVLCRNSPSICRRCSHSPERGRVALGAHSASSAQAMASLFLAHVIGTVERSLAARFAGENLILQWNVGCPMDHLDSLQARELYEAMVFWAWQQRTTVTNPMSVENVGIVDAGLARLRVPEDSERVIHIRPETHAGIMAFLQSPHAEERAYAIVDVGAGTTEVSMLLHAQNRGELGQPFVVNYLSDSTLGVGGGDIDRELADLWGVDLEQARERKERGELPPQRLQAVDKIFRGYRRLCCQVAANKLLPPTQREYDLFVLGGGSRMRAVQRVLEQGFPDYGIRLRRREELLPPRNLVRFEGLESNFDLLALACGLSSTVFWDFRRPSEIEPLPPRAPVQRPDQEELYPK